MRRNPSVLFILLFITLYFANINYVFAGTKKEIFKEITAANQQAIDKGRKHRWEFSTGVSLYFEPEVYEKDKLGIYIPARIGYYISKNIEIEPEFNITYRDSELDSITRNLLFANLAYNFNVSSRIMPFLLVGGGIIKLSPEVAIPEDWPAPYNELVLNAGAGLKWFVVKRAAMRIEYRIIHYPNNTRHNMLIGISVFI